MTRCFDLHTHSTASDGSLAPASLVERARAEGVDVLALTDHDTTAGLAEAAARAAAVAVDLVPGVEVSVTWRRRTVHILGLQIDPQAPALVAGLARLRALRRERLAAMDRRLAKQGIAGLLAGVEGQYGAVALGRGHVARWLCAQGHVRTHAEAFKRYLGRGRPGYVGATWAALEEAVGWIRAAGGVAVIAHPAAYRLTATKLRELIGDFVAAGGAGIEVVSGPAPRETVEDLTAKACHFGLLASCGSDFHGPENPAVELGRLPALPAACTPVWQASEWRDGPLAAGGQGQ